jgi:hypothetical protein
MTWNPMKQAFDDDVRAALGRLDGTSTGAVSLMTGLSAERLAELGGVPDACGGNTKGGEGCSCDPPFAAP